MDTILSAIAGTSPAGMENCEWRDLNIQVVSVANLNDLRLQHDVGILVIVDFVPALLESITTSVLARTRELERWGRGAPFFIVAVKRGFLAERDLHSLAGRLGAIGGGVIEISTNGRDHDAVIAEVQAYFASSAR